MKVTIPDPQPQDQTPDFGQGSSGELRGQSPSGLQGVFPQDRAQLQVTGRAEGPRGHSQNPEATPFFLSTVGKLAYNKNKHSDIMVSANY